MRCVLLAGLRGSRTVGCGSAAGIEITVHGKDTRAAHDRAGKGHCTPSLIK
jgi:hypothetical protein